MLVCNIITDSVNQLLTRSSSCGNSLASTSTVTASTDCSFACPGNAEEKCGAGNRLSTYKNLQYVSVINPTITGYTYLGCYNDSTPRALEDSSTATNSMTVEYCASFCNRATYFGVEYARECYCGAALLQGSTQQPATDCSFTCAANSSEYCGAGNRLSLYKNDNPVSVATNATIPGYKYNGCFTDSTSARVLTGSSYANGTDMTIEHCAAFCKGYTYFGAEYASECYCGSAFANPTTQAAGTDCSMVCSGNGSEVCGAGNRLSLYEAIGGP